MLDTTVHAESVALDRLDPNPFASRLRNSDVIGLSISLSGLGQLTPISVRNNPISSGRYQIIFGHRRVAAARALGWSYILARISSATDEQMVTYALAENLERNDYSDYEKSLLIRRLHDDFGRSYADIATLLGRSKAYVSQHIAMTTLFESGSLNAEEAEPLLQHLSERQARSLLRVEDQQRRYHLARLTIQESLSFKEIERLIGRTPDLDRNISEEGDARCTESSKSVEQITDMIHDFTDGLGRKDIRPILVNRSREIFTLFDDFSPPDLLDYEQAADHHVAVIRQAEDLHAEVEDLKIKIYHSFAFATFFVNYKILRYKRHYALKSRVTFILVRKENRWNIVHEHWSPFGDAYLYYPHK